MPAVFAFHAQLIVLHVVQIIVTSVTQGIVSAMTRVFLHGPAHAQKSACLTYQLSVTLGRRFSTVFVFHAQ